MTHHHSHYTEDKDDLNLVEMWLNFSMSRILAGVLAGVFAGLIMILVAAVMATLSGLDTWFILRVAASPFMGLEALDTANSAALVCGLLSQLSLCGFLGALYGHFTGTNQFWPLLGVGLTWGSFSWIFINNLFAPSFRPVYVAEIPFWKALIVWLVFGVALTSIRFFHRMLGSKY